MFECSLDGRPAADFSVAVIASRGDHAALSRFASTDITTPSLDNPGWKRVHEFARSWMDASSLLSQTVEEVWLEFDVCLTGDPPNNTPSVFFSLEYQSPQEPALRRRLSREYVRVAKEGLDILEGRRISPATLSTLAECFYTLPAFARILFLGAMISRGAEKVRVVASGLSLEDMVRYLQRLGLRKSVGHLAFIADISHLTDYLWLAIDIEETGVTPGSALIATATVLLNQTTTGSGQICWTSSLIMASAPTISGMRSSPPLTCRTVNLMSLHGPRAFEEFP